MELRAAADVKAQLCVSITKFRSPSDPSLGSISVAFLPAGSSCFCCICLSRAT